MPVLINPYRFGAGAGAVSGFVTSVENIVDGQSWNFGTVDIGAAAANRVVVCGCVVIDTGGANQITSVVLGGNAMTRAVDTSAAAAIGTARVAGIYYLPVAAGATATLVLNALNTAISAGIAIWSIYPSSPTPIGTASAQNTTAANVTTGALAMNAGGIACAVHQHNNAQPTGWVWSGVDPLTEELDEVLGDSAIIWAAATIRGTANTTLNSLTVGPSNGSPNLSVACASWGA